MRKPREDRGLPLTLTWHHEETPHRRGSAGLGPSPEHHREGDPAPAGVCLRPRYPSTTSTRTPRANGGLSTISDKIRADVWNTPRERRSAFNKHQEFPLKEDTPHGRESAHLGPPPKEGITGKPRADGGLPKGVHQPLAH